MTGRGAYRFRVGLAVAIAVAVMAADLVVEGQDQPLDPATSVVSADNPAEGLAVRRRDKRGRARFAAAAPQRRGIRLPIRPNTGGSELALDFVDRYGDQFGIQQRVQLRLRRRTADALGEHVRFEQVHQGVPVTGGEFIVHLRGTDVTAANGAILDNLPDNVVPTVAPADAILQARLTVDEYDPAQAVLARYSNPRLEIWAPEAFGDQGRTPRLAWFVEATADTLRRFIWIDAQNGDRLLTFNQVAEAKTRSVYTGNEGTVLPGTLLRTEGASPTGDVDADRAYDYAGFAYDYYKNTHNRDSYDGLGAPLVSTVHHCEPFPQACPWSNAYWNGGQMVYGDGYASADDVVAHELTHAVTETSAGLFYYMQSGALNESFSDIFGETVDLTDGAGTDTAGVRWRMGEDLPIGAIRNMMTPTLFNDPGKMSDAQYICDPSAEQGNGGVHTNSGVSNHAYALAVDGGTYNGKTVTGVGLTKAGKIWYRALTVYLTPAATFQDAYTAISQSATDLIGTSGITASDRDQVVTALQAVEMNAAQPSACLRLLSPNGGETWSVGSAHLVSWTAAGLNAGGQIYILLSQDGGQTEYPSPLAVLPPGTTSYSWTPLAAHVTAAGRLFVGSLVNNVFEAQDWSDQNFAIDAAGVAPTVTTGAASTLTQTSGTVSGFVNPNGVSTTLFFDYGLTTSYSNTATYGAVGSGIGGLSRSLNLTGLNCATTYQYRARAQGNGTANGSNQAFTTSACPQPGTPPAVSTGAAGSITQTGAAVSATVNPNGAPTTLYIDYGTTASYGSLATFGIIGSANFPVTQPTNLTGLSCSTTYQYRARAQNSAGTASGANQSFTTDACPAALPVAFSKTGVPANGATGQPLTVTLAWATSAGATSYEYCVDAVNNAACDTTWTSTPNVSVVAAGLNAGTTYWWQARGKNAAGTTDANTGMWWSFTTQLPAGTYFSSDLEGNVANWSMQSPWALTTESAHTSTHAWSDSPGGNYAANRNVSVTSPSIDLRTAVTPRLRFWRRYGLASDGGDSWNVWVTTDNGVTYAHLQQFVGTDLTWKESIIDLTPFTGFAAVRVVFQIVSNGSLAGDGLYVDDVVVEESTAATVTVTAPDADASEAGPDAGTFTFSRTGSVAAALTVNFTTTGGATPTADYADVGWTSVIIPAGQASVSKTVTPQADAFVEGAETVVVTLGAGSYTLGTPASATVTIADAPPGNPDLVVTALSAPPSTASPGSSHLVSDTTLNQGTALANASTTRFYLSLDAVKSSGDKLLAGTRIVLNLAGGASSNGSTSVTIPASLTPGTYFQLACADDQNAVAEGNETNNCLASGSTVQIMRADLVDTGVSNPPASVPPGGKFTITDTVLNPSSVWAADSTTRYYLSLDTAKSAADVLLTGTRSVPALASGASSVGDRQVTVPAATALNTYRLLACADDSAKVAETNEGNNCTVAAGSVVVGVPDLRTTLVNGLPPAVQRGQKIAPADTVLNQGTAPSSKSSTRYYLSVDAAWSAGDVLLTGTRSVPILAPNQTSGGSRTVTVPATTAVGSYFVLACADDTKKIAEGNETNNCVASAATIAVTP